MKGNTLGSAEFLSLNTWRVVTRNKWTPLPMPNSIIDKINDKAKKEKKYNIINEPIIINNDLLGNEEEDINNELIPIENLKIINQSDNNHENENAIIINNENNIDNDNYINEEEIDNTNIINADETNIINDDNNLDINDNIVDNNIDYNNEVEININIRTT
jgi:hypothetical protein